MSDPIRCANCGCGAVSHLMSGRCDGQHALGPDGTVPLQDWEERRIAREAGVVRVRCECTAFKSAPKVFTAPGVEVEDEVFDA